MIKIEIDDLENVSWKSIKLKAVIISGIDDTFDSTRTVQRIAEIKKEKIVKYETITSNIKTAYGDLVNINMRQSFTKAQISKLDSIYKTTFVDIKDIFASDGKIKPSYSISQNIVLPTTPLPTPTSQQQIIIKMDQSYQTSLLDASASFIAGRIKEEANLEFLKRFRAIFKDKDRYPTLNALFPTTANLLNAVDDSHLSNAFTLIKNAFEKDLSEMQYSTIDYITDTINTENLQEKYKVLFRHVRDESIFLKNIQKGNDPIEIIEELLSSGKSPEPRFLSFTLELMKAFQSNNSLNGRWISRTEFAELAADDTLRRIFVGMLYERNIGTFTPTILASFTKDIKELIPMLNVYHSILSGIDKRMSRIITKQSEGMNISKEEYFDYCSYASNLITNSIKYELGKEYQADITEILSTLFNAHRAAIQGDYSTTFSQCSFIISKTMLIDDKNELIQYGSFIIAVVNAKNTEDIQKAIEAAALPPGSYNIKRNSKDNYSLNVYAGANIGSEWAVDAKLYHGAMNIGFTVPVGFAINWGKTDCNEKPTGASGTFFISIFDFAAPVNFRLSSSYNEEALPKDISFSQLISPGLFYFHGMKESVFSYGFGISLMPKLRDIKANGGVLEKQNMVRANLFFLFDIPVFNFYTKPFDRK